MDEDDFDLASTLAYMAENPEEFSKEEMVIMLTEAMDAITELTQRLDDRNPLKDGHQVSGRA